MHDYSKGKYSQKSRIITSNVNTNQPSSNWRHEWWQFSKKSYASIVKSKKLVEYGTLDNIIKGVKSNANPNRCVKQLCSVNMVARNINHQGVKKCEQSYSPPNISSIKCVKQNHVENQGVNIKNSAKINKPSDVMDVHPSVKCLNRFAVLLNHNNVCRDAVQANDKQILNVTNCSRTAGESYDKPACKADVPRLSTVSGDKYDLELRFKLKHRPVINAAKNNDTFRAWDNQNTGKYGFIPLGEFQCPEKDSKKCTDGDLITIHNYVKETKKFNFMGAQICVPSQLNVDKWQTYLEGYWDKQLPFLLRYGFPLDFDHNTPLRSQHKNHSSATDFPQHVEKYFKEEGKFGAIHGPFSTPPLDNFHISPCMTREKPDSDSRRVIVDLSYPEGQSVNAGVSKDQYLGTPFLLTLPSIDVITQKVKKLGKGSLLYKIDISRAFRHIKIDPGDYNLLGLKLDSYFFDSCLPFGFRHGSAIFQRVSDAVRHFMAREGHDITNYIDDVIGHALPSTASKSFNRLHQMLLELGFDISDRKVVAPGTRVICLGVEICTTDFTVSIPPAKLAEISHMCKDWVNKTTCSKRDLQSLLGKLLYVTKCVRASRVFLNRMLDLLRSTGNQKTIHLTPDFRRDLRWFQEFVPHFNGKAFFDHPKIDHEIELDASLQGLGARWGQKVYALSIPIGYNQYNIVHLEMLNILVAVRTWGEAWVGKTLLVHCDNAAVVSVLHSVATRDLTLAAIARNITMEIAKNDINLHTVHIPGKLNVVADCLSRWSFGPQYRDKLYSILPCPHWVITPSNALHLNWSI